MESSNFPQNEVDCEEVIKDNDIPKRSRMHSKVWNEMILLHSDVKSTTKAKCKHCNKVLSASSKSGTSHLHRHLSVCPSRKNHNINQYLIQCQTNSEGSTSITNVKYDMEKLRKALVMLVVSGKLSFNFVEWPAFRHMMSIACPQFKSISRRTLKREIIVNYEREKEEILKEILNSNSRICLTSDNWHNESKKDEFVCITAHWIDKTWKLQKRIIVFKALTPPFDGPTIFDEIASALLDWRIEDRLMCISLDNAAYNDFIVKLLKIRLNSKNGLLCDGAFFQIRCCCHILNLIVQDGLKLVEPVIGKIRSSFKYLNKSIPKLKKFLEIASTTFHLNVKKKLRVDMCVRWNSTYIMIDRALYYKEALCFWEQRDKDFEYFKLTNQEWQMLECLHEFLHVFYEVTCLFSATKSPTTNIYFRGVWKVQMHLMKYIMCRPHFMTDMVTNMQKKFDKYWCEYNLLLSCAIILDPRYKLDYLEFCYLSVYGNDGHFYVQKVKDLLYNLFEHYKNNQHGQETVIDVASTSYIQTSQRVYNSETAFKEYLKRKSRESTSNSQLDQYLAEATLDVETDIEILEYWRMLACRLPEMAAMAKDILAISVSTVTSESAFSMGKKIINPTRCSLNVETIQALACYENRLSAKGYICTSTKHVLGSNMEEDDSTDGENHVEMSYLNNGK